MANSKMFMAIMIFMVVTVVFGIGYMVWSDQQSKSVQETLILKEESKTTSTTLQGKAGNLDVYGLDLANVDPTTKLASRLFIILNPVVSDNEISGVFAADGTTLSTSTRTTVTEGMTVGEKFVAIASNNTYFGFPTDELTLGDKNVNEGLSGSGQNQLLDLGSYTTTSDIKITPRHENTDITASDVATANLSIGTSEEIVLEELKIQVNTSNVAFNLFGVYIDADTDSNITNVDSVSSEWTEGAINIQNTEADDYMFTLSEPVLMDDWEKVILSDVLKFIANSNGCDETETLTIYALDKIWVKSTKASKMIYAVETDGDSPTDVGMTNPSITIYCDSN